MRAPSNADRIAILAAALVGLTAAPGAGEKPLDTGVKPSSFEQRLKRLENLGPDAVAKDAVVGRLGDPDAITFVGVEAFETDAIRRRLSQDLAYQAAARPSAKLADFLRVLAERVEEGYERAGYSAEVTANLVGRPVVSVIEGEPRHLRRIRPADERSARLADRFRSAKIERGWSYGKPKETRQLAWVEGRPMRLDRRAMRASTTHLTACLVDEGYLLTKELIDQTMKFEKAGLPGVSSFDLVIHAPREEPTLRIRPITIDGLTRHTRDEVLELIGVAEGDPLRADALERVGNRLDGCHRFWRHGVWVRLPKKPSRYERQSHDAALEIRLVEYEAIPRLGEPLGEVDRAALRVADWLRGLDTLAEDVLVEYASPRLQMTAVLSPLASAYLVDLHGAFDSGGGLSWRLDHGVLARPGECAVADLQRGVALRFARSYAPTFRLAAKRGINELGQPDTGRWTIGLGIGGDDSDKPWGIDIDPYWFLHKVRTVDAARVRDGVLILNQSGAECRFDAETGRPLTLAFNGVMDHEDHLTVTLKPGEFARRADERRRAGAAFFEQHVDDEPLRSSLAFVLDQLGVQPPVEGRQLAALAMGAARTLLATPDVSAWIDRFDALAGASKEKDPPGFVIPSAYEDEPDNWTRDLMVCLPPIADEAFPRGGWAWTALREFALSYDQRSAWANRAAAGKEFQRLIDDDRSGPVSGLLFASWYAWGGREAGASRFARHALGRLDEGALLQDLAPFTSGDRAGAEITRRLVLLASTLDDEQQRALIDSLPAIAATPARALLDRRAAHPNEPPHAALREAVLEAWREGWRDELRAELSALVAPNP